MQIECDHQRAASASEALLESCGWSHAAFFNGAGPTEADVLADGKGRTLHFIADEGESRCDVWLPILNPESASGLPDIAAHEGFHVAAGANVYHWTHEAFACLAAHLSHLRQEDDGPAGLTRQQLGAHLLAQARLLSRFYSAQEMRLETVPHPEPAKFWAFYARARVVGVDLYEVTGLEPLARLARAVRDARCHRYPHGAHESCPMDHAVEVWLTELTPGSRDRVTKVLSLT